MHRYRVVIMLVLFGVLPVVAVFFLTLKFLEEPEPETPVEVERVVEEVPPPEPPETRRVLAAARPLPIGALLGPDDMTELELDPEAVGKLLVPAPGAEEAFPLLGYVVREVIAPGAPITRSALVGPGQRGFLAAVLEPGTRAVTVRVGPATGFAGLVDPGDRVDVILSAELAVDGRDRSVFAGTIVEDVRVVAIDRVVEGSVESPAGDDTGEADVVRTEVTTATLEVSPAQGERLILGEQEGRLSLAVRPLATVVARTSSPTPAEPAIDMRRMLLPPAEFSASQERLRRTRTLNDLAVRMQTVESEQAIEAAVQAGATTLDAVRIFRGSEPAEEVVFARQ